VNWNRITDQSCWGRRGGSCAAALLGERRYKVLLAEKRAYLGGPLFTSIMMGTLAHRPASPCRSAARSRRSGADRHRVGVRPAAARPVDRRAVPRDFGHRRPPARDDPQGGGVGGRVASRQRRTQRRAQLARTHRRAQLRDWLNQYTTNPRIHGLFQSTIAITADVNSWSCLRGIFQAGAQHRRIALCYIEGGSLRLWERMAISSVARGAAVTSCAARPSPAAQAESRAQRCG